MNIDQVIRVGCLLLSGSEQEVITMIVYAKIRRMYFREKLSISEKISYRLAQRPGSYVILKYVRPVSGWPTRWPSSLLNFEDLLGHLFRLRRSYS